MRKGYCNSRVARAKAEAMDFPEPSPNSTCGRSVCPAFQNTAGDILRRDRTLRPARSRDDRALEDAFFFQDRFGIARGCFLFGIVEENRRAVLCAEVRSLAIERGGIVALPVGGEKLEVRNLLGIKFDFHSFRVAGRSGAHVLVGRICFRSAGVANSSRGYTLDLPKRVSSTPPKHPAANVAFAIAFAPLKVPAEYVATLRKHGRILRRKKSRNSVLKSRRNGCLARTANRPAGRRRNLGAFRSPGQAAQPLSAGSRRGGGSDHPFLEALSGELNSAGMATLRYQFP